MIQVPAPFPPGGVIAHGPPAEMIALISIAVVIAATALLWPIVRAWARRIDGKGHAGELAADVAALRERVSDLESMHGRLVELEERADFTERVLAESRAAERLPGGGT